MNEEISKAMETISAYMCKGEQKGKHIVVLKGGWVFVGDLTKLDDDSYLLTNASNVRKWEETGFGGLTKSPVESKAVLDSSQPIKFHAHAMYFCSPVGKGWQ